MFFSTDPFDLNHNLGAGLSRKSKSSVNNFIYKVKILSWILFYIHNLIFKSQFQFGGFFFFHSDKFYNEGFYQWQKGIWYPYKNIS